VLFLLAIVLSVLQFTASNYLFGIAVEPERRYVHGKKIEDKGNNKITEIRTILQRESQNS
jgi:hypothetical protein